MAEIWNGFSPIASPAATDRVQFGTGPLAGGYSERGSLVWRDAAGNFFCSGPLSVGSTSAPSARMHVRGAGLGATQFRLDSSATQPNIAFYCGDPNANNRNWVIASSFTSFGDLTFRRSSAAGGDPLTGVTAFRLLGTGEVVPGADNSQPVGSASFRWSVVYAATGTINTSDAGDKDWLATGLSPDELRAATRITREIGTFRWLASVAEKGDDARVHVGVRAQTVWAIMADEGLIDAIADGVDPDCKYGFLCWDCWDEETAPVLEDVEIPAVFDDDGNEIEPARTEKQPTGETYVIREAGDRFGIRLDQLALFLIAAQEARLAVLEAAA